ncbi:MAG TPA: DUF1428 domain-containing protein [Candidatus Paceibacterota bacterium]
MPAKTTKSKYVDGFVLVIHKDKVAEYKKMARDGAKAWKKFGALDYKECMGEDLEIKGSADMPAPLSFTQMAKAGPDETVWFSFITFKSKAHRNEVNAKVMAYFDKKYAGKTDVPMPMDTKRMAYGGFSVVVSS